MTAPAYRLFTHVTVRRESLLRVTWEVTDGYVGPVLCSGRARTKGGATLDASLAAATCEPSLVCRLERVADRLRREGLPVTVRVDEQERVCVTPLCACSTRDEVRVLAAFLAIVASVRWEVA